MKDHAIYKLLTYSITIVWIVNGLLCKILHLVPRHEEIVERILQVDRSFATNLTTVIGFSEVGMAIWVLSGIKTRLNAIVQMAIVALMNILEFILAPDLLLWGKMNAFFAFMFIVTVYWNEFYLNKKLNLQT